MKKKKKLKGFNFKPYWRLLEQVEGKFYADVGEINKLMAKATGIKDIEFFWGDDGIVGIGNGSRTLKLIYRR